MREIFLDGTGWRSADNFYGAFLGAVGAPEGHGHYLDALYDSIARGGLNRVELPYVVVIKETDRMEADAWLAVNKFRIFIKGLRLEGFQVDIRYESDWARAARKRTDRIRGPRTASLGHSEGQGGIYHR